MGQKINLVTASSGIALTGLCPPLVIEEGTVSQTPERGTPGNLPAPPLLTAFHGSHHQEYRVRDQQRVYMLTRNKRMGRLQTKKFAFVNKRVNTGAGNLVAEQTPS